MKLAKHDLLAALRLRYDHYSTGSIFEAALNRAGLPDQDEYDAKAITAFRAALAKVGDRLANVEARLDALLEAAPAAAAPAPAPAPAPAAKAAPEKVERSEKSDKVEKPKAAAKPEGGAKSSKVIETTIALAGLEVGAGEQVLVCGGSDALGDWNPEKAPAMKREGDTFLATVKVSADAEVPFKFLRRAADGTVTWEAGDDRQLVAKPRIEATWR